MKVLVTGVAGFIGFFTARALLDRGDIVIGVDNLNSYYDNALKSSRISALLSNPMFSFHRTDIEESESLTSLCAVERPECIVHLAAQAGVRYSLENPIAYVKSNLLGFTNILEIARHFEIQHLVYASTSSVYGANSQIPYSVNDRVDHPLSFYAATKKSNELMAHTYSYLYRVPTTGLRFFTVYGPWGRPDMSYFQFARKILSEEPIDVFNFGNHTRDFTYITDIVGAVVKVLDTAPSDDSSWDPKSPDPARSSAPYRIYNIGSSKPQKLIHLIELLEQNLGKSAIKHFLPMQPGDVQDTYANVDELIRDFNYVPTMSFDSGVRNFVDWYLDYYQ